MTKLERILLAVIAMVAVAMAIGRLSRTRSASAAEPLARALRREGAQQSVPSETPASGTKQGVDAVARFVTHPGHIQPGLVKAPNGLPLRNPYAGDKSAVATGAKLFVSYNCADCHGADGSGFMAPSLQDGRWHFGGSDAELFESIFEGRPDGMPAWGSLIAEDQIWLLVSYVRTLQGGRDVTTENFTGRTIERMGH